MGSSFLLDAAAASPDGRFVFASSFNRLTQLDPSGNVQWTQVSPNPWGYDKGVFTSDGEVVLGARFVGRRLTRFDATGAIVWDHVQAPAVNDYTGLVAGPNGSVVATANVLPSGTFPTVPAVEFVDASCTRTALVDLEPFAGATRRLLPPRLGAGSHPWTVTDLAVSLGVGDASQVGRILPTTDPTTSFCAVSPPNSTGQQSRLEARGSAVVLENCLTLRASQLPSGATTLFLVTDTSTAPFSPFGSLGMLCLGGSIGRYVAPGQIRRSSQAGVTTLEITPGLIPSALGPQMVAPGDTYYFQAWHRDFVGGQTESNTTNAIEITFQ